MKLRKFMTTILASMCVLSMLILTGCADEEGEYSYDEAYSYDENSEDADYAYEENDNEDSNYAYEEESSEGDGYSAQSTSGELGSAKELAGRTVVVSIFANDNTTSWDEGDEQAKYNTLYNVGMAADWISNQAAKYGCNAEFIYNWQENSDLYYEGNINGDLANEGDDMDSSSWEYIASNIDSDAIAQNYGADNMIYMIYLNTPQDHSITSSTRFYYEGMEYPYEICYMYTMLEGYEEGPAGYAHEMLHTFGAPDLYAADTYGDNYGVTEELVQSYTNSNSNDIMFTVYDTTSGTFNYDQISNEFTEIDAYYVGLTDRSSEAEAWGLEPSQH